MTRFRHILSSSILILLALMSVSLLPSEAWCRLTGEADFGYVDYESRSSAQKYSGSSFNQRYSFLYDTAGSLVGGRLGSYSGSIGYEWLTYDTTENLSAFSKMKSNENRGHINYSGEVTLNPKELPLKLRLFSQDPGRTTFKTNGFTRAQSTNDTYTATNSGLTTGIDNGVHLLSGATLVMGVKNGMTNGYNEVLRHFPMLMLDYRDEINKDLKRDYPVDNRLTRLAFVSLNKKDNWFHYRYVTYNDNIDINNNYYESQFQIGTVDHQLQRRWIDFSNWLNVSVDGQLTNRTNVSIKEDFNEVTVNLFATARREFWELRTFNRFTRVNEINLGVLTYQTTLPLYASGIISPTAGWNAYVKYDDKHTTNGNFFTTANGSYSVDAFRKSPFTLVHGLSAERVSPSSLSNTLILTGNIGTNSTLLFSKELSLKATYDFRKYRTESDGTQATNFLDQEIKTFARYSPTNELSMTAKQDLRYAYGKFPSLASNIQGAGIDSPIYQATDITNTGNSDGSSMQSISSLQVEWTPRPRLGLGLSGTHNIYAPQSGERETLSRLSATVRYSNKMVTATSVLSYSSGDGSNNTDSTGTVNVLTSSINSTNSVSAIFNRSLDANAVVNYSISNYSNGSLSTVNADQSLNYRYITNGGYTRCLFEINETFTSHEEVYDIKNSTRRRNSAQLGIKYYPRRQMVFAGGAKYFFVNNGEDGTVNYYGSFQIGFRLLTASIDYIYAKSKIDDRVEKRLSANLKKRF